MNTVMTTLKALLQFALNKSAAIALFVWLVNFYRTTTIQAGIELIYTAILIVGVIVTAPLIRLLVFPECAVYAESGELKKDLLMTEGQHPARLVHYWKVLFICYAIPIACAATLHH